MSTDLDTPTATATVAPGTDDLKAELLQELSGSRSYFDRSTAVLSEEHSNFQPTPDSMSTAQHVAHVALTIDWFVDGAFAPEGFDMDFEAHHKAMAEVKSLRAARAQLDASWDRLSEILSAKSAAELNHPLPPGPVMGGQPRSSIVGAIAEHTAHHRGALTVHSRMNGLVPAMPYM